MSLILDHCHAVIDGNREFLDASIEIDNGIIAQVQYYGGCAGNTQGVAALVRGMRVQDAIDRLSGIRCGFKSTSCPDQLALALREYLATK